MNKCERIKYTIEGKEVDKVAYSFWTHLPKVDLDPIKLANETYDFYREYDIDFIKTMNNGMYAIEDFDCEIDYSEIRKGGVAKLIETPITFGKDWLNIEEKRSNKGALNRELTSLKRLVKNVQGEAPILFTIFSPITIADKLSRGKIFKHIEEWFSKEIHIALEEITKTTTSLIKDAIEIGIDGIFFASQTASYDKTCEKTYKEFGLKYDLKVLESASSLWFNTIHAHGNNIMFDILKDYPVSVFNWHIGETLPEPDVAYQMTNKCLMGGLKRMDITNRNKNEIMNQIYKTLKVMDRKNIILTPGCVIRYPLDKETLNFIKYIKEEIEAKI